MSSCDYKKDLLDARYFLALLSEEELIATLDYWLEQWLYYKDQCPNCGTEKICS